MWQTTYELSAFHPIPMRICMQLCIFFKYLKVKDVQSESFQSFSPYSTFPTPSSHTDESKHVKSSFFHLD